MKIMDKYLFREYLLPVFYCLSGFIMIYVVYDLFDHLSRFMEAKTPLALVFRYYLCLIVTTLDYLVPASLLLATLYTLWHLTRNNELVALRASGVSILRTMCPLLCVGLAFALTTAVFKETVAPKAALWAMRFAGNNMRLPGQQVYRDQAYYNSSEQRLWLIEQFDERNPEQLIGVKIKQEREDGTKTREIIAQKAEWLDGHWWFYNIGFREYGPGGIPISTSGTPVTSSNTVTEMAYLTETPMDFANEMKSWIFLSTVEMWRYLARHPNLSDAAVASKKFDLHSRLAMPWACLIVTLFGIPVGTKGQRQSVLTGVFLAITLFFGFYALMQVGVLLGKGQIVWPWLGAWLSNIVFLIAGVAMVARMK